MWSLHLTRHHLVPVIPVNINVMCVQNNKAVCVSIVPWLLAAVSFTTFGRERILAILDFKINFYANFEFVWNQ